MAMGLNLVILIGHLGADPEMKYIPSGAPVTSFRLATNRSWKNSDGEREERVEWHNCECWGSAAEFLNQYGRKGRLVLAIGRKQTDQYESPEGEKKYFVKLVAQQVQFLDPKPDGITDATEPDTGETVAF